MRQKIAEVIADVCKRLFSEDVVVDLDIPDEQFGDFSTNIAMLLAKQLGRNPREIALEVELELSKVPMFESVGVAGPGFINITLKDEILKASLSEKPAQYMQGMKVLVEYSDPNPFKPLHAGHLYTTLVGDVIARLVEKAGAKTIRLNYGGDVGRHVGISMWSITKELGGEDIEAVKSIPKDELAAWMGKMYSEGTLAFEHDESVQDEIKVVSKKVYAIHESNDHESDFAQIYWYLRDQSYEFFRKLYADLRVSAFDRYIPESEVTSLGIKTVEAQLAKGVFKDSDGAVVFEGEEYGLHTRVFINSEGLPTYEAKDIGLSLTKWQDYKFDESIIITANEQSQYMQVVLKAIEQFAPEIAERTKHLTHGIVRLSGGVKMSSRKGNILSAFDILDSARKAGKESGQASNEEVVLASVKYALLKSRIGGDIIYDPKESISMEGNSGPYLQYAHARACSIIEKAKNAPEDEFLMQDYKLNESERSLVLKLSQYSEAVFQSTFELSPHILCTYLYELAQNFNRFYEKNKVIGTEQEIPRIGLVGHYVNTLSQGLGLLGIQAPKKM